MTSLSPQIKHFFGYQEDMVDFLQDVKLLIFTSVVGDGPNHGQAQVFLVGINQLPLDGIHAHNNIHNIIVHFFQKGFNDSLQWFQVIGFLHYLHYALPAIRHDVPVVDDQLVYCQNELVFYLLELAVDQVYPWLQKQLLVVGGSKWRFKGLRMAFKIIEGHRYQRIKQIQGR